MPSFSSTPLILFALYILFSTLNVHAMSKPNCHINVRRRHPVLRLLSRSILNALFAWQSAALDDG
jgi:hypothetical protein